MGGSSKYIFIDRQEKHISYLIGSNILLRSPSLPYYGCKLIYVNLFSGLIEELSSARRARWFSRERVSIRNTYVLMCA